VQPAKEIPNEKQLPGAGLDPAPRSSALHQRPRPDRKHRRQAQSPRQPRLARPARPEREPNQEQQYRRYRRRKPAARPPGQEEQRALSGRLSPHPGQR